jgi:hypothetical protein
MRPKFTPDAVCCGGNQHTLLGCRALTPQRTDQRPGSFDVSRIYIEYRPTTVGLPVIEEGRLCVKTRQPEAPSSRKLDSQDGTFRPGWDVGFVP